MYSVLSCFNYFNLVSENPVHLVMDALVCMMHIFDMQAIAFTYNMQ